MAAAEVLAATDDPAALFTLLSQMMATPMLFEIFRIDDGRFAEMWGASTGFPTLASPENLLS